MKLLNTLFIPNPAISRIKNDRKEENPRKFRLLTETFDTKAIYLRMYTFSGRYQQAYQFWQEVVQMDSFSDLEMMQQERWKLFETYLLFALWVTRSHQNFRKSAYSFSPGIFPKSNQEYYNHLLTKLIGHFLTQLNEIKLSEKLTCATALHSFGTQHLQDINGRRWKLFMELVQVLINSNFQAEMAEYLALELIEELNTCPFDETNSLNYLEIIPFENLWHLILRVLYQQPRME